MLQKIQDFSADASVARGFEYFSAAYDVATPAWTEEDAGGLALLSGASPDLLAGTPLDQHFAIPWLEEDRALARAAVTHLSEHHAKDWRWLGQSLKGVFLLDLKPEFVGIEGRVTSITLPGLPFVSLISRKAYVHAPPSILADEPSVVTFAENLIHEAAHQVMNLNLVEREILRAGYTSEKAVKIEIPWRSKAFQPRDRAWPTDRCLHAAFVYLIVYRFRTRAVARDAAAYLPENVREARANGLYLVEKLLWAERDLTDEGLAMVHEMIDGFNHAGT